MNITQEILYKYLEIILEESEITGLNSSMNILNPKYLNVKTAEERNFFHSITEKVVELGIKLKYCKYVSKEEDWFELTEKGILVKSKGGHFKYLEYIKNKELEKVKSTIIAENYIGGNNNGIQSFKSDFINLAIHKTSNTIPIKPAKRSFLEILSWVFGIIVAFIAIYEFILKKL